MIKLEDIKVWISDKLLTRKDNKIYYEAWLARLAANGDFINENYRQN